MRRNTPQNVRFNACVNQGNELVEVYYCEISIHEKTKQNEIFTW